MEALSDKKRGFVAYLDKDNSKIEGYFFYKIKNNLIFLETKTNIITIPTSRLLKLKEARNGDTDS